MYAVSDTYRERRRVCHWKRHHEQQQGQLVGTPTRTYCFRISCWGRQSLRATTRNKPTRCDTYAARYRQTRLFLYGVPMALNNQPPPQSPLQQITVIQPPRTATISPRTATGRGLRITLFSKPLIDSYSCSLSLNRFAYIFTHSLVDFFRFYISLFFSPV